ncbi:hypothetical protein ES703_04112 [subsurface metagenome]
MSLATLGDLVGQENECEEDADGEEGRQEGPTQGDPYRRQGDDGHAMWNMDQQPLSVWIKCH